MAGAWFTIRADLHASLRVAANARQIAATLQTMFEMQRGGGTIVQVPASDPVIWTLIQPDGDIVTKVRADVFDGRSRDELAHLIEQHQAALEARLPAIGPGFAKDVAGFVRSLRRISWAAPVMTAGTGIATKASLPDALTSFAPFLVAACIPVAVRLAAPSLLRLALRRGLLHRRL